MRLEQRKRERSAVCAVCVCLHLCFVSLTLSVVARHPPSACTTESGEVHRNYTCTRPLSSTFSPA